MDHNQMYEEIRKELRSLNQLSLIEHLIIRLHQACYGGMEVIQKGMIPWEMLLLLKWALREYQPENDSLPPVEPDKVSGLQNRMQKFYDVNQFLGRGDVHGMLKFFRQLSHQQFWHQQPVTGHSMAQQLRLFMNEQRSQKFQNMFFNQFGVTVGDYFKAALLLRSYFFDAETKLLGINAGHLENLTLDFRQRALEPLLKMWSLDLSEAKHFADRMSNRYEVSRQLYETSPFKDYPFIRMGENYICLSPKLIEAKMGTCIYDALREACKEEFTQEFGKLLEPHLRDDLEFSELNFRSEKEIRRAVGKGLVPDFLVETASSHVFIESKGVELHVIAKVDPTYENMMAALKNNVVKAVNQCFEAANRIPADGRQRYALIITYKQLYLGSGKRVWDEFVGDAVKAHLAKEGLRVDVIDPSNIFFTTVAEFEGVCRVARHNPASFDELMTRAGSASGADEKHVFGMYAADADPGGTQGDPRAHALMSKLMDELPLVLQDPTQTLP